MICYVIQMILVWRVVTKDPLQQVRLLDLYVRDICMQRVSVRSVWVHHFRV